MCLSKPKRKVDLEHRQFQATWTIDYFLVEFNVTVSCLICKDETAVLGDVTLRPLNKRIIETKLSVSGLINQAHLNRSMCLKLRRIDELYDRNVLLPPLWQGHSQSLLDV